jgi:hypothetical protein
MTETKIFVVTNGLVYAHDTAAGQKGDMASEAILELWNTLRINLIPPLLGLH